jgi:hypothetical protein
MKHAILAVLALSLVGCLHEPQVIPHDSLLGAEDRAVEPPTPAQVASCKSTRSWHNFWILSSAILGGAGGATGAGAAISDDKTVQEGVAIGAVSAGILAAFSTAEAGITADTYSTNNCVQVLQSAP